MTDFTPQYAKTAFSLMEKHHVSPSPENYAVWFQYATGKNKELIREIDNAASQSLKFSPSICSYLYNTYAAANRTQKVVDDTSVAAQKVLQQVLKIVQDASGEQKNYNKDVDQYLNNISQNIGDDENVRHIFKQLVTATTSLRQSGESISKKLEESKTEINALKQNLQQVTMEAQRDFLTGLYNRKSFEHLYVEATKTAQEDNKETCLMMLDIDHFKRFNDKYGHLLGDEVLKIVARTLTDILKGRDIIARFGGEEFIVLLPETPLEGALRVAEVIRNSVASKELKRKDTGETYGTINVSIGVARMRAQGELLPALTKRADDALYQSKHRGRNCVTRASD